MPPLPLFRIRSPAARPHPLRLMPTNRFGERRSCCVLAWEDASAEWQQGALSAVTSCPVSASSPSRCRGITHSQSSRHDIKDVEIAQRSECACASAARLERSHYSSLNGGESRRQGRCHEKDCSFHCFDDAIGGLRIAGRFQDAGDRGDRTSRNHAARRVVRARFGC